MSQKKIAVVLSGCGHLDGAEVTESVSTLIALSQLKAKTQIFAPDIHFQALSHLHDHVTASTRNSLEEAARIARGNILPLDKLLAKDFDAVIFCGGNGAANLLCDWASKGYRAKVIPVVERCIREFHSGSKPIGAICIAPVLIALVIGEKKPTLTIGDDESVISEILKTGSVHEICPVDDFITDRENKCVSTPAYMYNAEASEVFKGISGLVKEVWEMA